MLSRIVPGSHLAHAYAIYTEIDMPDADDIRAHLTALARAGQVL